MLGVPLLALVAAVRTGPLAFALVVAMVVVTVRDHHSIAGQLAALGLIAASCTVLGARSSKSTPARWLGLGIAATAAVDLVLVASGFLAPATIALNDAGVTESLPQLQRVELGPLTMGYADLFLPALVGALLAKRARTRHWVALLTLCFALGGRLRVPRRRPAAGDGAGRARAARRRGSRRYGAAMARSATPRRRRPDAEARPGGGARRGSRPRSGGC